MEMTPEFKAKLVAEVKHNTIVCVREYIHLFNEFVDMMEKTPDDGTFEALVENINTEANQKANSAFQRFLISYIVIKNTAMDICKDFFEHHEKWENEQIKQEENIEKIRDSFMKRTKELLSKQV